MEIRKISKYGDSLFVSIPKADAEKMGLTAGKYVTLALNKKKILHVSPINKEALRYLRGLLHD